MKYAKRSILLITLAVMLGAKITSPKVYVLAGQTDAIASMPDAPGKDITVRTCTKCHAITNVTNQHRDTEAWTATITKMVEYGATGSDNDLQQVLDYVSKYYGPNGSTSDSSNTAKAKILVNKETASQLSKDLNITEDESKSIVDYRVKNGNFKKIEDLKKVPRIDAGKLDAHAADLSFD